MHEVRLQFQFPNIYRTMNDLGLRFMFNNPKDCNLTLVCKFYANWLTQTKYKTVSVRAKILDFSARVLNEVVGTPHCDAEMLNILKDRSPYRDILYTLCNVKSNVRWERSKYTRRNNTL